MKRHNLVHAAQDKLFPFRSIWEKALHVSSKERIKITIWKYIQEKLTILGYIQGILHNKGVPSKGNYFTRVLSDLGKGQLDHSSSL